MKGGNALGKLVYFEIKKLMKIKFNCLLILLTFILCLGILFIKNTNRLSSSRQYASFEGETLNNKEVYRYADTFFHEHRGIVNDEYINDLKEAENLIIQEYQLDEIDEEKMIMTYGKNYQEIIQAGIDGSMSDHEIFAINEKAKENNEICKSESCILTSNEVAYEKYGIEEVNEEDHTFTIRYFYEKEESRNLLNLLLYGSQSYTNEYTVELLHHKEEKLADTKNYIVGGNASNTNYWRVSEDIEEEYIEWQNQKYLNAPERTDSGVGATMFVQALTTQNNPLLVVLLLCIVILVCQVFTIDHDYEMESMLLCSKKGYSSVMIAKIITACLIPLALLLIYLFLAWITVSMIVPIRNLDIAYVEWIENRPFIFEGIYTYKEILFTEMSLIFMSFLAASGIAAFVSTLFKNKFIGLMLAPSIIVVMTLYKNVFTPGMMLTTMNYLSWNDVMGINMMKVGTMIVSKAFCAYVIWCLIDAVLFILCLLNQRRHIVR